LAEARTIEQIADRDPTALWWLVVAFMAFWVGLLFHESAHYVAEWFLFAPSDWARPAPSRIALVAAAGPIASLGLVIVSAATVMASGATVKRVAALTAFGASSRLALTGIPTFLGKANDEHAISVATGLSAGWMWAVEALVTTLLIGWILRRANFVAGRGIGLSVIGIVLGWIAALTFGRAIGLPI
jgi:hypothetical protein